MPDPVRSSSLLNVSGPDGLRMLAAWFDATQPGEIDQVQQDLRRWASDMERAADRLDRAEAVVEAVRLYMDSVASEERVLAVGAMRRALTAYDSEVGDEHA